MRNVKRIAGIWNTLMVFTVLMITPAVHAEVDKDNGKALFKAQCAKCHYVTDKKFVGPGLKGVRERWNGDDNKLIAWIRNSSEFLKTGDAYANALYKEYNNSQMPAFNLSDDEILSILAYIDDPGTDAPAATATADGAPAEGAAPAETESDGTMLTIILVAAAIILLVVARSLNGVTKALENIRREKAGEAPIEEKSGFSTAKITQWIAGHKRISGVVAVVIVSYLAVQGFNALNSIGVYQGYEPEQPIKFSHALHVGQNKIDCQYCHSTAAKSKHANIPSANVCMNCHKAVQEGPQYGRAEITKIYASIGWDPIDLKFIPNYNEMPKEQVEALYKKYLTENGQEDAFDGVKAQIQKPIEWVQIHNLPDHAYFNHQQHVAVGKVECQTCHGDVGKMDVVYQASPLTMGWCINCHRKTEVQYASNGYYERLHEYYKSHKGEYEMRDGQAFTVEKIGGLECSKCHY